jgi:hypothetical protein
MAKALIVEQAPSKTAVNTKLLQAVCVALEADAFGFDMKGFAIASAVLGQCRPVNLREHFAHVMGLDYLRLGEYDLDRRICAALGLPKDLYLRLVELSGWPDDIRAYYKTAQGYKAGYERYSACADVARIRLVRFISGGE